MGANAYLRYSEAFNDCAPDELPRFAGVQGYVAHAARIHKERQILLNEKEYSRNIKFIVDETSDRNSESRLNQNILDH